MYSVSSAYKTAMKQNTVTRTLRGSIGNISFDVDDVLAGACSVSNKISDGTEIKIGSVNISELSITFINDFSITDWSGLRINIEEGVLLAGGTYEYVPIGTFIVSKAERTKSGVVITAYDNMSKFDKIWSMSSTSGTAYSFLSYICQSCDVQLGVTQAYVESLPNGSMLLGLYTENDIETFRDALSWIAQTLGSYATIDRNGALVIRSYKSSIDDTVTEFERYSGETFSTFSTRYSGVSVVDIKNATTRYVGTEEDVYLTYNLGSNPFMQYGTTSTKEEMLRNVLSALQNINYVPFSATVPCGGAYDLGDVINFSGGIGDAVCCITSFTWNFYGSDNYIAKGEGKDPNLSNAKSKTDKNLEGLASRINSAELQYYIFRNLEAIDIGDGQEKDLINIRFTSMTSTTVIMQAEVLLDVDTTVSGISYNDAVGTVTYYVNLAEVTDYVPVETWVDGNHILHLLYVINIDGSQLYRFTATLKMTGGSVHIPPLGVNAVIHGQGLAATEEWDGYLDFEETLSPLTLQSITVKNNITDSVTVDLHTPHAPALSETLNKITLGGITLKAFNEVLLIDKKDMSDFTHQGLTPYTHEDLETSFIHG